MNSEERYMEACINRLERRASRFGTSSLEVRKVGLTPKKFWIECGRTGGKLAEAHKKESQNASDQI
jgi:hypothetical protein